MELYNFNNDQLVDCGSKKRIRRRRRRQEVKHKGWRVKIWSVEVGVMGFPTQSVTVLLRDMGYT